MAYQSTNILHLPRELLDHIAGSLPTRDFNALRLTCKGLENKIFPYWVNCFFRTKQFMISDFSLQALLDISHHEILSRALRHLIIGLDNIFAISCHCSPNLSEFKQLQFAISSQESLIDTGEAVRLLSAALANLPNLETIDIRDFCSPTRRRDNGEWKSYGSSVYTSLTPSGRGMAHPLPLPSFLPRVFKVVITSLGRAQCPVQRLQVILRTYHMELGDDSFAFVRQPDAQLRSVLGGLKTLHLDLSFQHIQHTGFALQNTVFYDPATPHLRRFLALTPNITWLRLNVCNRRNHSSSDLLNWLALKPGDNPQQDASWDWSEGNPEPPTFPLTRLELGRFDLQDEVLTSLLKKFNNIESLTLRRIKLSGTVIHGDSNFDDYDGDNRNPPCLWSNVIRQLPTLLPKLKRLHLDALEEESPTNYSRQQIIFMDELSDTVENQRLAVLHNIDETAVRNLVNKTWTELAWHAKRKAIGEYDNDGASSEDEDEPSELEEEDEDEGEGDEDEDMM